VTPTAAARCPFCFPAAIDPEQLLLTTQHFYLLASRGQIVPGYLTITTHACRDAPDRLRCLDDAPAAWIDELDAIRALVDRFYRDVYDAPPIYYEHGRGGAGSRHPVEGYLFHPHLCVLPGDLSIHEPMEERFAFAEDVRYPCIRQAIGSRPYLFVQTPGEEGRHHARAYYAPADRGGEVHRFSIKQSVVETNDLPGEWDWRAEPSEPALHETIARFGGWYRETFSFQRERVGGSG
jgi:hypothetical protein